MVDKNITVDKNIDITSNKTKNIIISYLHKYIENPHIRYQNITSWDMVDTIKHGDYVMFPSHSGSRTWILFFTYHGKYYAVSFPQHNIRKRDNINIYPIPIKMREKIYNGTILEGIYRKENDIQYLIIDDVHYVYGKAQIAKSKSYRLNYIRDVLKTDMISDSNNMRIMVNKCYNMDKFGITELFDKVKNNYGVRDIIFYPSLLHSNIFQYTILESDRENDIIKYSTLILEKTKLPDVYHLLTINNNNNIGIAYIPDKEISKLCNSWFKSKRTKSVTIKCKYNFNMARWIPFKLIK